MRIPAPHWPSVAGRARADAGPLLLAAVVVAVVTLLAGAVPPLLSATADAAVRDAVRRTGGDLQVHSRMEDDDGPGGSRVRHPRLAEDVDDFRARATDELGPGLRAALRPPVATVTSPTLKITDGSVLRTFQLAYVARDGGPDVTWIAGGPPRPTASETAAVPYGAPPWPVQVGLSEADAAALRLRPGAHIPLADDQGNVKKVQVSGVFRPRDSADPAWRLLPSLLSPVAGADGTGSTRFAGLLSRESLPDARLAFGLDELRRTVSFTPDPARLTWDVVPSVAAKVVALKASSGSSGARDGSLKWETRLDGVLRNVSSQVEAAFAQASVLLVTLLAVAVLVLLLAADLLVRRRAPALAAARQRGMSLPVIGGELLLESAVLALLAAAAGLGLARAVAPGVSWDWTPPVVVTAVAAGPAFGMLTAARATRDRRVPANRSARRWARDTVRLRRAALETGVLAVASGALVALYQRGIGGGVLPASAPALCVLAGALLPARALPLATRFVLKRLLRSSRPLAVFGAARAAVASARVLPLLVLVTSVALASYALIFGATVGRGTADGPLASGLLRLAWVSAVTLPALGLLGLALGTAAGAPERWQTLTRLRTLGLRPREARWVAAGELLPPVVVAAVGGPLLGVLLARLTFGSLALRLLTGAEPAPASPWWALGLVAVVFLAAVAVVVPVESALRRRRRLSEVLRAGDS
ncbi:FtsX-like permease family protein [Nonomuraea wenchangensis]|uniref:Putative ABC transport system permease protein n=1 Tax=Nonomuraea wenchangensis TaxID=568860 RepID=A0A1I0C9C1_9ACTN|nr:FtsX-like permease family protein [Nonomuraea wenchangensis]SET15557.1 putative ABC transport system permease protein [Nonomuraea wenchangensis]